MTETELLACEIRVRDGRPRRAKVGPLHPASDVGDILCEIQFRAAVNYTAALYVAVTGDRIGCRSRRLVGLDTGGQIHLRK